ncbi:MAG: AAA family ATPase, partial [Spirochaetaceae bacterium]|nr:AAA family ATPase [Spirochaetaceae bacterium]
TIFLVLLNLLVVPKTEKKSLKSYVFAFEELENNLHPALLRRLFSYLEKLAIKEGFTLFLTTHSNIALDIFGTSENAQIIRVVHDGKNARAERVASHFDRFAVVSELGLKPSDLLQANGIIWVEGPSDRVYLNRWIHLLSNGEFEEGRDYQCAFYGGALLARVQFKSEEEAEEELVNLFRVNPNVVVVCDSDKTGPNTKVKGRVRRIRSEVLKIPKAYIWVTAAREIENYIKGDLIAKACGREPVLDPGQYEHFFPRKGLRTKSYIERRLSRKNLDKMEFASAAAPLMDLKSIEGRFDLKKEVETIIDKIRVWNS